ncbi:MAG: ZIP family metal transporter [Bacillota bacterium]
MNELLRVALVGLVAGVAGTGLGGVITACFARPDKRVFSTLLGFSAGIMISVVAFDLMPEALELAPVWWGLAGLLLGVLVLTLVDLLVPHIHFLSDDLESSRYVRASLFVGLGIAMHNLPEGLAIGAGFGASERFGTGIAVLMALQNFPEGMAMGAPMVLARVKYRTIILATAAAGLPMGAGAILGYLAGGLSPLVLALALGFAGGAMLFVVCDELIPDAQELRVGHSGTFGIILGVVTGILVSTLLRT